MRIGNIFRKVVNSKELFTLAERIRNDLPYSATMYNALLMKARNVNPFQYDFYAVKNCPESHIIIWITEDINIGIHCREEETPVLLNAIKQGSLLTYGKKVARIFHLPDYLIFPLYDIVRAKCSGRILRGRHDTFIYQDDGYSQLRCPPGMQIRRLGAAGVRHLIQNSTYNKSDNVELMQSFTSKVPAVGVYLDPSIPEETTVDISNIQFAQLYEIPIAWITTYHYGSLGMLMTDEKYRRLGLATLVSEAAAKLQIADGYVPHVHVDFDNPTSAALFEKQPGWKKSHTATWLVYFEDQENQR
ncbi:hypothetical protein SK128_011728 [Halocaridina rubra]|uniref:GCN5-related N-acetyltransferase Rv2170-like domain-containing protein n=1 Tax=Halocaridina rubra TaxID=373956 RepID=A0AAN9AFB4_HALRR